MSLEGLEKMVEDSTLYRKAYASDDDIEKYILHYVGLVPALYVSPYSRIRDISTKLSKLSVEELVDKISGTWHRDHTGGWQIAESEFASSWDSPYYDRLINVITQRLDAALMSESSFVRRWAELIQLGDKAPQWKGFDYAR